MPSLEELRTRLAYIADSDSPLVRIELAPIEAAELLEALPDPAHDVEVSAELAVIATMVEELDTLTDDPAALDRVMNYLVDRYPATKR